MWPVNQKQWTSMSNSAMGIFEPFSAFWKLTTERVLFSLLLLRLSGNFSWKYWVGSSRYSSRKVLPNSMITSTYKSIHPLSFLCFTFCLQRRVYNNWWIGCHTNGSPFLKCVVSVWALPVPFYPLPVYICGPFKTFWVISDKTQFLGSFQTKFNFFVSLRQKNQLLSDHIAIVIGKLPLSLGNWQACHV